MPLESESNLRLEIGHVLFIDIVGYSKLLIDEQREVQHELNDLVRNTAQFRKSDGAGGLTRLPTGDGMALIFRDSMESPLRCAIEISRALKDRSDLRLRMGIHSGPVSEVTDVNDRSNVAGAGMNIAQRVMDCGDAGHILLSKRVAEDLTQYRHWQPHLHDLGECEVKHGVKLGLVNFYDGDAGNPAPPQKCSAVVTRPTLANVAAQPSGASRRLIYIVPAVALVIGAALWFWSSANPQRQVRSAPDVTAETTKPVPSTIPGKSIAVLPFENLSDDKSNAYFAEGIQDEILTKLASIADLKVISRTSTAKYKSKPEDLKTVSQQLGVATVLEGSVQKSGEKVRVNVQLIDARADSHLWAKSYDRDLKDVFAVESEVSQEVADALRAKLSPSEANVLATAPTRDPEAYDLFLKGEYDLREGYSLRVAELYDHADAHYRQALTRDPDFALATARLAYSRLARHWWVAQLGANELDEVKTMLDRALAMNPNLSESHEALGLFYYWRYRDYAPALEEFRRAIELQPNNSKARHYSGAVYRRQGQWERSLAEMRIAEELDPRDPEIPAEIGLSYVNLRQWNEAKRASSRSLALDPHSIVGMSDFIFSCVNGDADLDAAERALGTLPAGARLKLNATRGSVSIVIDEGTYLHVLRRDFAAALKDWDKESNDPIERMARLSARIAIRVLAGKAGDTKGESEEARVLLEGRLRERPDDAFAMTQLSWVYVALDRKAEALRLARQAADSLPIEKDALSGPLFVVGLAQIEAHTGETREAVNRLRHLLSIPAGWLISVKRLEMDPVWDPIRNDPEFQKLLTAKEQIGPNK